MRLMKQDIGVVQAYRTLLAVQMAPPCNLTGYTEIDVAFAAPSHCVVLHAARMEIDSVTALLPGGSELIGSSHVFAVLLVSV